LERSRARACIRTFTHSHTAPPPILLFPHANRFSSLCFRNASQVNFMKHSTTRYFTTTSGSYYYHMKTNIKAKDATMYRLEILGYAYGAGKNIDSISTGYTYAGTCVRARGGCSLVRLLACYLLACSCANFLACLCRRAHVCVCVRACVRAQGRVKFSNAVPNMKHHWCEPLSAVQPSLMPHIATAFVIAPFASPRMYPHDNACMPECLA
jgi:hypothetical protein